MLFDDWSGIWRTLVVGTLAYVALVVLLRISGKRTLSKMNAFGIASVEDVGAVVLEMDGSFAVLGNATIQSSALQTVRQD